MDNGDGAPEVWVEEGIRLVASLPAEMPPSPSFHNARLAWHPGGRDLLYIGAPTSEGGSGPLALLPLLQPSSPRRLFPGPVSSVAWRPDGAAFAFTGAELVTGTGSVPYLAQVRLSHRISGGLMPPEVLARRTPYFIQRWLDRQTLATVYPQGSSWRLALLDTEWRRPIPTPPLEASLFTWSAAGDRVAGQSYVWPDPPSFWLWDRRQRRLLLPQGFGGLPGASQFFEAWSPDGRAALFTAWDGTAYDSDATPTLYLLDVEAGTMTRVAENAAQAAWSGEWMAYLTWEPDFALTMTRARDRQALWTEDLGIFPYWDAELLWDFRPRFAGPYVAYRNTPGLWRVGRADRKEARPLYRGDALDLTWSPEGRHIAFIQSNEAARLLVVQNPLAASQPQ